MHWTVKIKPQFVRFSFAIPVPLESDAGSIANELKKNLFGIWILESGMNNE